ncbi:MAG TPA: pseudouridine synthase [Nevskiaceae bacterium]|nr:pseudouridine synthase [Nevskiaceae bacterium]
MRLNKFIAETGRCSRREADAWIAAGRVQVNGRIAELGTPVTPQDEVRLDGRLVQARQQRHVYLALNKPRGITCTTERHVAGNIIDFIGHRERIFPIGRLDKDSDGLILLTSNGDIVNEILRVENHHEKEYEVTLTRPFDEAFLSAMAGGLYLPELAVRTRPCTVQRISRRSFRIVLTQGLNRQIRRMCEVLGHEVQRLQRLRIIGLTLGDLRLGQWRELSEAELAALLPDRRQWHPAPSVQPSAGRPTLRLTPPPAGVSDDAADLSPAAVRPAQPAAARRLQRPAPARPPSSRRR